MRTARKCMWGLVGALALAWSSPAFAQAQPAKKKSGVIRIDDITVEGRIQKPQAFYILQRSKLNYQGADRAATFLPRISKSLENDPF